MKYGDTVTNTSVFDASKKESDDLSVFLRMRWIDSRACASWDAQGVVLALVFTVGTVAVSSLSESP